MFIPRPDAPPEFPVLGSCFGFEVRSGLDFEYLRPGPGAPTLVLPSPDGSLGAAEHLQTWDGIPGVQATIRLSRASHPDGFGVEVGSALWFRYERDRGAFVISPGALGPYREALLWGTPAAAAMADRGDLVIHAASVDVGGAGILLSGPGGTGKTTLAAAFESAGHRLLSDDFSGCRLGTTPAVLPGPSLARLRPDSAERLDLRGLYVAWEEPGRIYAAVEPARRGGSEPVPLERIVLVEPGSGPLELRPAPAREALRDLWAMSFWLPQDGSQARCFEGLSALLDRVPAVRLRRPKEWSALEETVAFVADRAG